MEVVYEQQITDQEMNDGIPHWIP